MTTQATNLTQATTLFEANLSDEFNKLKKNKPNVLIVGRTGAGKSSLVNGIFGQEFAKVGAGSPVTSNYKSYSDDKLLVNIFDSMGWEGGGEGERKFLKDTERFLKDRTSPDDMIHVVWYALDAPSARFTDFDAELIRDAFGRLQVIIVLTKCDIATPDQIAALKQAIDSMDLPNVVGIVETAASPLKRRGKEARDPFGLGEVVTFTEDVLPEARKSAFIAAQIIDLNAKAKESKKVVLTAVTTAFGIGATPIPFADRMLLTPLQLGMVAQVGVIYNIKPATAKSIASAASGFAGVYMATVTGVSIASNLLKLIPITGQVAGGAITGTVAATITASMGFSFRALFHEMLRLQLSGKGDMINEDWINDFLEHVFKETWKSIKEAPKDMENFENIAPA